jgi:iron complex outermembrane receptor protein
MRNRNILRNTIAAVCGSFLSSAVFGQVLVEEMIITAQKREQNLQDVGISVSAFSGDQLRNLGMTKTVDITQQVPGLQLLTFTPALTVFNLRGVSQNNFQDNLEAPVAVYMDGVYLATMNALNGQMFDMQRVEVLRGPQGTLFGRNATGGLIHFISRGADDAESNGYVEATVGDYGTRNLEAAAGGSLSDAVRARVSGRWEKADGYVEAGEAFGAQASGRDSHGADGFALRAALQGDLGEDTVADLTLAYAKDDNVPSGQYTVALTGFDINSGLGAFTDAYLQDPVDPVNNPPVGPQDFSRDPITGDVHKHFSNYDTGFDRDSTSATLQISHDLSDALELVSITNITVMDKDYLEDAGGGFGFFPYRTVNDYEQFSQELRISGDGERLRWQAGAYYLDMTADTFQTVSGALILGGTSDTQTMDTFGKVDSRNWSLFGQAEFDLTDTLTLIGGLRWSQDDKEIDFTRYYSDEPNGVPRSMIFDIGALANSDLDEIDYGDYAGRVQLDWKPGDDLLAYVSLNRGIKGGNWSIDPLGGVSRGNLRHKEEVLYALEAGIKYSFADGLGRVNAAVFGYDYDDYQAFSLTGLTPQVTNSDAEATGGEIELVLAPVDGLDLMFGLSYIDSTIDAVPDVFGGTRETELPNAPELSLNWLLRYAVPVARGELAAQVDGRWNDDQYLEGTNSEVSFEGSYAVWNARLSYSLAGDDIEVSAWVKNLTDEEYRLYNLDIGLLGFIEQVYAPPRQYGVTLSYRW